MKSFYWIPICPLVSLNKLKLNNFHAITNLKIFQRKCPNKFRSCSLYFFEIIVDSTKSFTCFTYTLEFSRRFTTICFLLPQDDLRWVAGGELHSVTIESCCFDHGPPCSPSYETLARPELWYYHLTMRITYL